METKQGETFQYTVSEAIQAHMNRIRMSEHGPSVQQVISHAQQIENIFRRDKRSDRWHRKTLIDLSDRSGCIATEILGSWWRTAKNNLPKEWQDNPNMFREALKIAMIQDVTNLYIQSVEKKGSPDFEACAQQCVGRRKQLGQFREDLEAKASATPQKERK